MDGLLGAHIPHADLLIAGGRDQQAAAGVPGQTLHDVIVLQGVGGLAGANVPQLDREVAGRGREDVLGGGVEEDLANLSVR